MKLYANHPILKDSLNKILGLATLTLYGVDVQPAVDGVIDDVFRFLTTDRPNDPDIFLRTFKDCLIELADCTDDSMSSYKKTLHDAVLQIQMTGISPHIRSVNAT